MDYSSTSGQSSEENEIPTCVKFPIIDTNSDSIIENIVPQCANVANISLSDSDPPNRHLIENVDDFIERSSGTIAHSRSDSLEIENNTPNRPESPSSELDISTLELPLITSDVELDSEPDPNNNIITQNEQNLDTEIMLVIYEKQ